MKNRQSRLSDARQNVSKWEKLHSEISDILSSIDELSNDVQRSQDEITRTWEDTSSTIQTTQREVGNTIDQQETERRRDAKFDQSDAATPPEPVPETASSHGNPDLPDVREYEIPDPVRESDIRAELNEIETLPAGEPERPVPFTEREWFELHSNQFPIGEDLFVEDVHDRLEETDREPHDSLREAERTERSRQGERDREGENE